MALILQHYWQSVNTCPKAIGARGTQMAVKYVSVGFSPQLRCMQPFQVMHGLRLPSREMTTWQSQGMTTDHHSTSTLKVTASKHWRLQLVSPVSWAASWLACKNTKFNIIHNAASGQLEQQDTVRAGPFYSELAWQVLMTWITQVQGKMTAAIKLSSLRSCLFIFHW